MTLKIDKHVERHLFGRSGGVVQTFIKTVHGLLMYICFCISSVLSVQKKLSALDDDVIK
jgi:hypothetical protein